MSRQKHIATYCSYVLLLLMGLSAFISYQYYCSIIQFGFDESQYSAAISPYIAVTVDDRATPKLVTAVLNVLQHIPKDWKVQIFTYKEHWPFYQQSSLAPFINNSRVFMTPINFKRNNRSPRDFINLCLTSPSLWRQVQGEKVLYFQIDSVICSNSSYKLTDFLHYDYIGAPWKSGSCCNGGFSIRSRSKTILLLEKEGGSYSLDKINEDGWFAENLPLVGGIVAPISVAKTFAVETIYYPRPFAVHNPYLRYLGKKNMKRLCDECPETRTISNYCI